MTPDLFLESFAQAIVGRTFDRAESMLAPWVRDGLPAGGLKRVVRLAQADAPPAVAASVAELDFEAASDLRDAIGEEEDAPSLPVPAEITDENFRGCYSVEFLPDEDIDADVDFIFAFFVAAVELGSGFAVGYMETVD
ncbi:MAG: hypothetical protein JWM95_1970 [Gemmatimonadetes bacterium]|nr:hypothetical protein [Gemmatimonadota bacterium]